MARSSARQYRFEPTTSSRSLAASQLALFEPLYASHPRSVWGTVGTAYMPNISFEQAEIQPLLFNLPPFIDNFEETLAFFRRVAVNAAKNDDPVALGVIHLFCRKAFPFNRETIANAEMDKLVTRTILSVTDEYIDKAIEQASAVMEDNSEWAIATVCFRQLDK